MQISSTASSNQADAHFRAVCRALVAETLEFSDFLVKVSSGMSSSSSSSLSCFHVLFMMDCRFRISSRRSSLLFIFLSCLNFMYLTYKILFLFFLHFNGTTAPEDWRELRNNKSDTHSHELTELHLADWVSNSTQLLFSLSLSYKTGKKRRRRRNLTRQTSLSSSYS